MSLSLTFCPISPSMLDPVKLIGFKTKTGPPFSLLVFNPQIWNRFTLHSWLLLVCSVYSQWIRNECWHFFFSVRFLGFFFYVILWSFKNSHSYQVVHIQLITYTQAISTDANWPSPTVVYTLIGLAFFIPLLCLRSYITTHSLKQHLSTPWNLNGT